MNLTIKDLKSILKIRVDQLTAKKASDEPIEIVASISDIRDVLDEIEERVDKVLVTNEEETNS